MCLASILCALLGLHRGGKRICRMHARAFHEWRIVCRSCATPEPLPRHILGIFPNHNASPCLSPYVPISAKEKFKIASEDAFDPGAVVLAALTAGAAQLFNSNRPFGQEASGYSRYFGAAYGNHVIGDFLTEGVYPSLLHQDPRYFRKGSGSARFPREVCDQPGLSDANGRRRNGI